MELIPVLSGVAFAAGLGLSLHAVKLRRLANNAVKHAEDLVAHGTALMDLAKEKEQRALRLHERALAAENSARELHRSLDTVTRIHDSRVARQADQFISRMPSNVRGLDQHREIQLTSHAATTPHRRRSDTDSDWPTVEQCSHDDAPAFKSDPVVPELRAAPEPINGGGEYSGAGASSSWVDSSSDSSSSSSSSSGD